MDKAEKRLERYFLEYLKNDIPIGEYATSNQCIKDIEQVLNILEQLQQENQELKEAIEDYERIFDIWSKRTLINKFNKEYSKKVVKEEREKGHKIVSALPDAEYVYKKYYELQERIDKAREFINENKDKYYQDWGQDDCSVDIYLGEYEIKELLDILNGEDKEGRNE